MSNPHESDGSSIYDADWSSDATSLEITLKKQKHYILRRKDSPCIETEPSPCKSTVTERKARPQVEIRHRHPAPEIENHKNPRRYGKADWRPDVSSVLFSASGRQYGLGDQQRGYHSNTYVTHLSYPESVTDQPRESRRLKVLRHIKCWQRRSHKGRFT
jgi:hypothetical protein